MGFTGQSTVGKHLATRVEHPLSSSVHVNPWEGAETARLLSLQHLLLHTRTASPLSQPPTALMAECISEEIRPTQVLLIKDTICAGCAKSVVDENGDVAIAVG